MSLWENACFCRTTHLSAVCSGVKNHEWSRCYRYVCLYVCVCGLCLSSLRGVKVDAEPTTLSSFAGLMAGLSLGLVLSIASAPASHADEARISEYAKNRVVGRNRAANRLGPLKACSMSELSNS